MNMDYYKNFIKIADLGNISLAAKILLIAQPSLSKQIQILEKEFGTPLLKRNARNVELTTAGEIFYQKPSLFVKSIISVMTKYIPVFLATEAN